MNKRRGKPAKRKSSRSSQNNSSKTEPSSPWLVLDNLVQQWCDRLKSSREAVGELWDLLRDPDTRSALVSVPCLSGGAVPPPGWVAGLPPGPASLVVLSYFYCGEFYLLDYKFWRNTAYPEVVPDVDGVGDRLEVQRPTYVHGAGPFSFLPGGRFLVRRSDPERWERLYFPMTAAPPPAAVEQDVPARKPRRLTAASRRPKSKKPKKPKKTPRTRLISLMKEIGLEKVLLDFEAREKVRLPFKKKYPKLQLPAPSTINRAYEEYANSTDTSAE